MPNVFRGKAQVSGTAGSFDVILYPITETAKLSHEIEEDIVQDETGSDMAWRSRNEKVMMDLGMYLVGDSVTHANAGAAFFAPYAIVTLGGVTPFAPAVMNTTWQIVSGSSIDLQNTNTGKINFRLRRYVDGTQNALAAATPS